MHPHRLDDELLSFWIVRTAHANRIKLQTFTTLAFGREAMLWNRDVDRSASDALLGALSAQTGSSVEELRGGMLPSYEGTLFERHNANGNTNWILPLGIYHRTRKGFGVQFCPLCLFFDPIPYFRRSWRLSFSTMCDRHGTMLHDRCPGCASPVVYFRNDLGKRSDYRIGDHVTCWKCGFDLRRAPTYGPFGPNGRAIMALRSLVAFHNLGWWFQGDAVIPYGHLYFEALHHLLMCLPSARGRRLLEFIERETGWRAAIGDQAGRMPFDLRPIGVRHELLVAALWLLDDWPERFVHAAKAVGLAQSHILRNEHRPFWFESEIRLNMGAGFGAPTAEEAKNAAAYLAKGGDEVSGASVGRLIGGRDAEAAKPYAKAKAGPMSDVEFRRMIDRLDAEIAGLRPRSRRRLVLQRDKTIFRLIRLTGWTARKVLGLTVGDAVRLASMLKGERDFPG
ncbi:MAG: TniQ family protein, partial [Desulfobacterales bacterium]|nr:TniQ family protein [Desulfobacterales bacterium]